MDNTVISAWIESFEDLLDNFISEPSEDNQKALLTLMTGYRDAIKEELSNYSFNLDF